MKIKLISLLALLALFSQNSTADQSNTKSGNVLQQSSDANHSFDVFKQMTGDALYGYMNFTFNSVTDNNFSSYTGHSNLYSIGGDQLKLSSSMTGGIYLFRVDTSLNSQIILNPSPLSTSYQLINNNTVFAHIMKNLSSGFFVDVAGGYGQNKVTSQTVIAVDTINQGNGQANYHNNNWFTSVNALYSTQWNKLQIRGSIGGLYSQIDTGSYILKLQNSFPDTSTLELSNQIVAPLSTKTSYLIETGELAYSLWPQLSPFINGALLQVVQFSNSRPLIFSQINGTLPELNLNQNAYRIGGGINYNYKQIKIRLEEKYYNADSIFSSTQTLIGFEYQFS